MSALLKRFARPLAVLVPVLAFAVILACTGKTSGAKEKPRFIHKEGQGPSGAVASIDGKPVSEDELMGDERLEFADLLKKLYDLRMERMGRLLLERKYTDEAKKDGTPVEEYVSKKILGPEPKISDGEYQKFVKDKNIPKEQLNEQLKERIMGYMKAQKRQEQLQALIVKLSKEHKVEVYFSKPSLKVNVDVGQSPSFGPKDAKVTIVEFSDFQCPYCSRAATTVSELKKAYGKKVLFAFKHYPLPMHPQAKPASEASMCVNEQSVDKFWKYHDALFANAEKLDDDSLKKYAKDVGADVAKFEQCIQGKKYARFVQDDLDYGSRLGVRSTPTFFINGRLVSGALPFENFKEIIDEELTSGT